MTNHEEYIQVTELTPDHHFRTEIPNIIYELKLNPYELAVYNVLKRIAGDSGSCWMKAKDVAEMSMMSKREYDICISKLESKFELIGLPLIRVERRKRKDGGNDTSKITIVPIWNINGRYFRERFKKSLGGAGCAWGGVQNVHGEGAQPAPKEDPSEEDPSRRIPLLPLQNQKKGDEDFFEISGIKLKLDEYNDLLDKVGEYEIIRKIEHIKANSSCKIKNWYKTILEWKIPLPKKAEKAMSDFEFCQSVEKMLKSEHFIFEFNYECAMINATTSQMQPIITHLGIEGFKEILTKKLKEKGFQKICT